MTQQSPIYFKRYLAIPFVQRNCFPFLQSVQLIGLGGVAALRDRHVGFENERMTKDKTRRFGPRVVDRGVSVFWDSLCK